MFTYILATFFAKQQNLFEEMEEESPRDLATVAVADAGRKIGDNELMREQQFIHLAGYKHVG